MPVWLLYTCCNGLGCSCASIIICLPFIATPSIITNSSLDGHKCCVSYLASALLHGQPSITYIFRSLKCVLLSIASCMSCSVMHAGISVVAYLLNYMSAISLSLFSTWFHLDSQSVMYRSGPEFLAETVLIFIYYLIFHVCRIFLLCSTCMFNSVSLICLSVLIYKY